MAGKFIVIVGPSAAGKTELVRALVAKLPNAARLVTMTTRPRRSDEGEDYFFITRQEFESRINSGDCFEHAEVYGNLYGSSRTALADFRQRHDYVFAIIDVQGAQTLKDKIPDALAIFIRPGNLADVKERLIRTRTNIDPAELIKRLETTERELELAGTFDAIVENPDGHFQDAVKRVMEIIG